MEAEAGDQLESSDKRMLALAESPGSSALPHTRPFAPKEQSAYIHARHDMQSPPSANDQRTSARPTRESVLRRLSEALLRRSLTKIDLSQRGLISSDARLVKLALLQNSNLSCLKLGYNDLRDEGVATLAPGISAHKTLKSLDLGFNNVGDEGCTALAHAMLSSRDCKTNKGTLQTLYLAGNLIGEDGALALAGVIRGGCRLRKLHLSGNRLGPDGVQALTEAIAEDEAQRSTFAEQDQAMANGGTAPTLQGSNSRDSYGIQELFLGGTSMGPNGCRAVARMLEFTSSLRVISLGNCEIGDSELALLSASIKRNKSALHLESLQLSFNNITGKGLESLMNAVWGAQDLCELRLDNNNIGDRGAQQVAAILPSVTNLKILDIGFNSIKSVGMRTLMKMVAETHHLSSLSISGNPVDTAAAKAVAYGLAYNRSLRSVFLDHCSIGRDGERHIAAGVVSNSRLVLRKLTGFRIGPPVITIGLPSAMEHWTNEQVLKFVRLMWEQSKKDLKQGGEVSTDIEEDELDPLHFLPDQSGDISSVKAAPSGPLDANVVVEVAKRAFASLGENGHDVFSRCTSHPVEPSFESPLAGDTIMVESPVASEVNRKESPPADVSTASVCANETTGDTSSEESPLYPLGSFVAPPQAQTEAVLPDPARKRRIVEWLCKHVANLNELAQLPFNSSELWRLHQHYFVPVVKESGGPMSNVNSPADGNTRIVSSVPDVSRGYYPSSITPSTQSYEDNVSVPTSDQSLAPSPPSTSLPILKRKVSYRFLGDAAVSAAAFSDRHGGTSVSKMIEDGAGHSMPPNSKRARRNKSRISFLPRIKAKLESYLDVCHEKALILLRQLHYVERALLRGEINPCDPSQPHRTHLTGVLASEAEMILIDMM